MSTLSSQTSYVLCVVVVGRVVVFSVVVVVVVVDFVVDVSTWRGDGLS